MGDLPLSGSVIRKSRFILTKERRTIFLEKEFVSIKVCVCVGGGGGVRFADFISFILNIP